MNQPTIRNIVCTTQIPTNGLNLKELASRVSNTEYKPARFTAMVLRIKEPVRATALLFPNGKIVCVGTSSISDAEIAMKQFVTTIAEGQSVAPIQVKNIVCSFNLGHQLRMNGKCYFT
jgi:transcription initiation factor TFIID TATA-box-binding protein